jgi:hypothetical protein
MSARSRSAQSVWRFDPSSRATVSSRACTAVRGRALGSGLASFAADLVAQRAQYRDPDA